jgi:hypothetical protein
LGARDKSLRNDFYYTMEREIQTLSNFVKSGLNTLKWFSNFEKFLGGSF